MKAHLLDRDSDQVSQLEIWYVHPELLDVAHFHWKDKKNTHTYFLMENNLITHQICTKNNSYIFVTIFFSDYFFVFLSRKF